MLDDGDNGRPPGGVGPTVPDKPATVVAREEGAPGFNVIKLRLVSPDGEPVDLDVGRAGFSNHSPSVSSASPTPGADQTHRTDIAWIESARGDASGMGRVMWQRVGAGLDAANDNATWVADHAQAGAFGSEPSIATLSGGETFVTWIGADGHAHGRLYPPDGSEAGEHADAPEYAAVNASLADLGPVATAPEGNRRLQMTETRPGHLAIMWLALADHGFVLRGSMVTTPVGAESDDHQDGWTQSPIADIRPPPEFAGLFSLQGAGDGSADVVVTYSDHNSTLALARRVGGPGTDDAGHHAGPEFPAGKELFAPGVGDGGAYLDLGRSAPTDAPAFAAGIVETHSVYAESVGDHPSLVLQIPNADELTGNPIVTAIKDGYAVTWETPGDAQGTVAIRMAIFDSHGVARTFSDGSTVITVADNALATVAPSIADVGSGAAVAYVDADEGQLIIKAYDSAGGQVGPDVVVDTGADGAISEVSMGSHHGEGQSEDLSVVYVRDDADDQPDYGHVVLQRYQYPESGSHSDGLVALGSDGHSGGDDTPVELTEERDGNPDTVEDVLGRAPTVTGLDDGDTAVVWVETDGTRETIKGSVLESDGDQVLHIDLSDLLGSGGIAKGSKPILLSSGDGDILVSWLQQDGENSGHGDGYVVMAALYRAAGDGQWIAPDDPVRLQEFDEAPKDFSVTWSDPAGSAIDVVWRDDSSGKGSGNGVLSQRYDLDGNDLGYTRQLGNVNVDHLAPDTLTGAGMVDGQIVVVYAEQSKNGDLDPATHTIDTATSVGSNDAPSNASGAGYAIPEGVFSTVVDQEIAINVPVSGSAVSHVNGLPISAEMPVDVGSGWVQLREDGHLTLSPDDGYTGTIAFDYTVDGGSGGSDTTNRIQVNVAPDGTGDVIALAHDGPSVNPGDVRLADIVLPDGEVNLEGLSQAGLDADLFKVVGTTLYLKAGIDFDFGSNSTLNVEVHGNGSGKDGQSVNFSLNLENGHTSHMDDLMIADTFVFAPGFGTPEDHSGSSHHEIIDVSSAGYETFQELIESGALVQAGDDVVLTFDPANPDHSDKITLRGIDLSVLTSADFKF